MYLLSLLWITIAEACGVGVHLEIVKRILPLLPHRIAQHADFVRSGAFYPDAFYNCQGQYDVAEDAHWPPFLAKGAEIVRQRRALGQNTDKFEAFLVGILTHQVSDVSWHSLGLFQGLLRAMADMEFGGDYDEAHSNLDIGGDMIWLARYADQRSTSTEWDYDVDDITELLVSNGYDDIPASSIHFCMARGRAAYTGELQVASVAFRQYARRSPFIFNRLESYKTGGLSDMTDRIEECLPSLYNWLNSTAVSEESDDPWSLCPVFAGCKQPHLDPPSMFEKRDVAWKHHLHKSYHYFEDLKEIVHDTVPAAREKKARFREAHLPHRHFHAEAVSAQKVSRIIRGPKLAGGSTIDRPRFGSAAVTWGSYFAVSAPGEGRVYLLDERLKVSGSINSTSSSPIPYGQWPVQFGEKLAVWNSHLVVSSPGISQLDIYNAQLEWVGGVKWQEHTSAYGTRGLKMVGEQLCVDKDDQTLYVGAPHSDYHPIAANDGWIEQAGIVYALPKYVLTAILNSPRYIELRIDDYLMHHGADPYDRSGSALHVTPRFVLVGQPGKNQVLGFDFATHKQILELKSSADSATGFGEALLAGTRDYLVIGSPYADANQEGEIAIYKNNRANVFKAGIAEEFGWFGQHGAICTNNKLIVASSYANAGKGQLWMVDLATGKSTEINTGVNTFASGIGSSMVLNGTTLLVGMPYFSDHEGALLLVEIQV